MMNVNALRMELVQSGYKAVEELIKVAKEKIVVEHSDDPLAADKMKNAAAAKKLAIFDALEILERLQKESEDLGLVEKKKEKEVTGGFAERHSK
jgi:hypothetical protein